MYPCSALHRYLLGKDRDNPRKPSIGASSVSRGSTLQVTRRSKLEVGCCRELAGLRALAWRRGGEMLGVVHPLALKQVGSLLSGGMPGAVGRAAGMVHTTALKQVGSRRWCSSAQ